MKKIIENFFIMYQEAVNLDWDNLLSYHKIEDKKIEDKFILTWDIEKILNQTLTTGLIESIHAYSNVKLAPQIIPEFCFLQIIEHTKDVIIFGTSSNGYDFCLSKNENKISLIDYDHQTLYFDIAKSEEAFLQVLITLCEFQIFFLQKIKVDKTISSELRKKAIQIAGGEEYSKWYNYTIISENDQPLQPPLVLYAD